MKTKNAYPGGKHQLENKGRINPFQAGMRSAALLLRRHRPWHSVGFGKIPVSEVRPKPLMHTEEQLQTPVETTLLTSDSMAVGSRKPLMTAEQIKARTGLSLGSLQAVVCPSGDTSRLLCFSRSTYSEEGEREVRYLIITDDQLDQIQRSEATGFPLRNVIKEQTVSLRPGRRQVIGESHPMPGRQLRPGMLHDGHGKLIDNSLAGGTVFSVSRYAYPMLYVEDLASAQGTEIQHSAEFLPAQDPWPHAPLP